MFGYIRPNKLELKLKDIYRYNDLYCSLCNAIRTDYGQVYGCALSYDLTFLLTVLNGLSMEEKEMKTFRCPLNPFKKKNVCVSEKALHYAAFINYFLMYLKIADDVADDNNFLKKILERILEKNKKYVQQYDVYADIAEKLKMQMISFNELEKKEADFDELSNSFGSFFSEIFLAFLEKNKSENRDELQQLCFNLGKWIYLIDAYDDYLEDVKKGRFNLLKMLSFGDKTPTLDQVHQRVQLLMGILIGNMRVNLKKIYFKQDYEIFENIILHGCNMQYIKVLKRRYPDYYQKRTNVF